MKKLILGAMAATAISMTAYGHESSSTDSSSSDETSITSSQAAAQQHQQQNSPSQQNQQQDQEDQGGPVVREGLSIEEIRQHCDELQGNRQIKPFKALVKCSETREFLVPAGKECFYIPREGSVHIKASIKDGTDGRQQTEWWEVPMSLPSKKGECQAYERWEKTAYKTVSVTCETIRSMESEASFCAQELQSEWAQCDADQRSGLNRAKFQVQEASNCDWRPTGETISCGGTPCNDQAQQQDQTQQQEQEASDSTSSGITDQNQAQTAPVSQQDAETEQQAGQDQDQAITQQSCGPLELGANVEKVKVKKRHFMGFKTNPSVVRITSTPLKGGLLDQLSFRQGQAIYQINGVRIRSKQTLIKQLRKAQKSNKAFRVEYQGVSGKFYTQTVKY